MTMHDALAAMLVLIAGFALGIFFFGGLWWSVRKGLASKWPALWFFASLIVRMSATLAGFYMIADSHWQRWLLSLAGFLIARLLVSCRTRLPQPKAETPGTGGPACA
jgi:F1F0 ATPase subunit 2